MKKTILIMFIISILLLTACDMQVGITDNITAPDNNRLPLSGQWVISDYKMGTVSMLDEEGTKAYLGTEVLFHKDLVAVGEVYTLDPSYRIKYVNMEDYLIYQYKVNPEFLDLVNEEIQVISIVGKEQFFYEFMKISEDIVIVNIDGVFFYLSKVSDNIEEERVASYYFEEGAISKAVDMADEDILRTGILLGLKSLDLENKDDLEKWSYRTIFIRSHNGHIVSIQQMENILLPRRTGFWKIEVVREETGGKINDKIMAYPVSKTIDVSNIEMVRMDKVKEESSIKNILYVGNDYISIENIQYRSRGERFLEFYPIESIDKGIPMKISDIAGQIGKEAFEEGFNKEILLQNEEYKKSLIDLRPNEESFGLYRRNGHWVFEGRIHSIENGVYEYKNFNIKAIPPKEIVQYDEMPIPWNVIKTKVPDALDAFISPNEDIVIVVTHNSLLIYLIYNGQMGDIPVERIELKTGEKVIMAEWTVGRYPQIWEEEFTK